MGERTIRGKFIIYLGSSSSSENILHNQTDVGCTEKTKKEAMRGKKINTSKRERD